MGFLIGLVILSCSSEDDNNPNTQDPIVGEWKEVKVVEFSNGQMYSSTPNDCLKLNRQIFKSDGTYAFKVYDNEFNGCSLFEESTSGNWSKMGSNYEVNFMYYSAYRDEELNGNEDTEYEERKITIENDTLKLSYEFSPTEITIINYIK